MHFVVRGIHLTIVISGTLDVFESGCWKALFLIAFVCQETTVTQIVAV